MEIGQPYGHVKAFCEACYIYCFIMAQNYSFSKNKSIPKFVFTKLLMCSHLPLYVGILTFRIFFRNFGTFLNAIFRKRERLMTFLNA